MSEFSCKYCGREGMDKHQNLVHVCDRATVEQRYDEQAARIAELEAQLAAATERLRELREAWAGEVHEHNVTIVELRDAQQAIADAHAAVTRQIAQPEDSDTGEMIVIATILEAALAASEKGGE